MISPSDPRRKPVHTLLGKRQLAVALRCLPSLLAYSADPVRLILHDDGSLDGEDWDHLEGRLGTFEQRPRGLANQAIEPKLEGYPRCLAFRRSNPLALKLVDVALGDVPEETAYCDADVLFLHPFRSLFDLPSPEAGALFMRDRQEAYSIRPWQLLRRPGLKLPSRANTGIVVFRRQLFDLDFIEWCLGWLDPDFAPMWVEQTLWALLGGRVGCWLLDARQILIPAGLSSLSGEAVGLHWVSSVRGGLDRFAPPAPLRGITPIRSVPAGTCGTLRLVAGALTRRFGSPR